MKYGSESETNRKVALGTYPDAHAILPSVSGVEDIGTNHRKK